jgi:hypothetical protein
MPQQRPPNDGDRARALVGLTVDGSTFDLARHTGQPVLVSFLRHAG